MNKNVFDGISQKLPNELIESLVTSDNIRIERIVSRGHSSPPGFWYDQETNEFVLLISGSTQLTIEGSDKPIHLKPGDWLDIPAHRKHRVEWTDPNTDTIWLAVHY